MNRRSFLSSLAGLPIVGCLMNGPRKPEPIAASASIEINGHKLPCRYDRLIYVAGADLIMGDIVSVGEDGLAYRHDFRHGPPITCYGAAPRNLSKGDRFEFAYCGVYLC